MRSGGRSLRLGVRGLTPPFPTELAVVTAYNPASRATTRVLNRAGVRELLGRARATGLLCLAARAHGTGPDPRRWDEPGVALVGDGAVRAAVRLAEAAGQNAILAADAGGRPLLVVTRPGFCDRRVGDRLS